MLATVLLMLIAIPTVMAQTGSLRISPSWPLAVESPADYDVWSQGGSSYDVNVLLVVTEECYDGMPDPPTSAITIEHDGYTLEILKTDFMAVTDGYVPPSGTTEGARYQVSALKDHLDYGLSEPLGPEDTIYWVMAPLADPDFDPLTSTHQEITVTVDSTEIRMLVYLLGKSTDGAELFDQRIPPTPSGFVIPQIPFGTIAAAGAMFAALGIFAYKKKHTPIM
jgi:hypothetical protein